MHQLPPAAEPLEAAVTTPVKQCWEPPVLDVLPLSETLSAIGSREDGVLSSG